MVISLMLCEAEMSLQVIMLLCPCCFEMENGAEMSNSHGLGVSSQAYYNIMEAAPNGEGVSSRIRDV